MHGDEQEEAEEIAKREPKRRARCERKNTGCDLGVNKPQPWLLFPRRSVLSSRDTVEGKGRPSITCALLGFANEPQTREYDSCVADEARDWSATSWQARQPSAKFSFLKL